MSGLILSLQLLLISKLSQANNTLQVLFEVAQRQTLKVAKNGTPKSLKSCPYIRIQNIFPNVAPPYQEGREVNTNTLPPPYQGLPPPSQVSEDNWKDIAHP